MCSNYFFLSLSFIMQKRKFLATSWPKFRFATTVVGGMFQTVSFRFSYDQLIQPSSENGIATAKLFSSAPFTAEVLQT